MGAKSQGRGCNACRRVEVPHTSQGKLFSWQERSLQGVPLHEHAVRAEGSLLNGIVWTLRGSSESSTDPQFIQAAA